MHGLWVLHLIRSCIDICQHALGLYFAFYNFCRLHKTLRVTPAMAAGITDKLWTLADIVALMDARAPKAGPRKPYNKRKA